MTYTAGNAIKQLTALIRQWPLDVRLAQCLNHSLALCAIGEDRAT